MSETNLETLPICERCWLDENTVWEPEGVDEDGNIVSKLSGVAIPENLQTGNVYICCMCSDLTIVGLFVERDPETVLYLSEIVELRPWED